MIEHRDTAARDSFPMRFLAAAMLLTCLVLGWLGWHTYDSYNAIRFIRERHFRIQQLQGAILLLDETLTMSARMAAVTGDLVWERRYRKYEPVLDSAIKEVITLEPNAYSGEGAAQTQAANIKLVQLEDRAFDLVRQNRRAEAHNLLSSSEYEAQKQIYSEGMTKVAGRLKESTDEMLRSEQRKAVIGILIVVASLPALLIGWLVVLRIMQRWRTRMAESNRQLDQHANALFEMNADLDRRVAERTADLYANQKLLQEAKEVAENASRSKSDFLANMSHEIRTPMNGILGMTELALDSRLTREQREYLETIKISADSLLTVISDILDFSKIEAGKLEMEHAAFRLRDTLEEALKVLAVRADAKGLELGCQIPPGIPDELIGDPDRLRQIFLNLIGNGVKFTVAGEVIVEVECESQTEEEVCLHFRVRDTGIGVPADKLEVIFEAFSQADVSTTRHYGGTGLGLTIATRLAELMGGRLWAESEPGKGSIFHFTARFGRQKQIAGSAVLGIRENVNLINIPVLVVDDNATNCRILEEILTNWGMRPTCVNSGALALDTLNRARQAGEPFALVLLDVHMPGMDGFQVAQRINQDHHQDGPAVMMLTSAARTGDVTRSRNLGVASYLNKPIRRTELLEAIRSALGGLAAQTSRLPAPPSRPAIERRGVRVLLAEDNAVNQKVALSLLTKYGHQVVVAGNGLEALLALDSTPQDEFDLILMDVQMPEMDGLTATAAIRQREKQTMSHIPIVAMTAHAMQSDRERCLAAGMDDYISKPFHAQSLLALIERLTSAPVAGPPKRPQA